MVVRDMQMHAREYFTNLPTASLRFLLYDNNSVRAVKCLAYAELLKRRHASRKKRQIG
jgi:hypothetical protein